MNVLRYKFDVLMYGETPKVLDAISQGDNGLRILEARLIDRNGEIIIIQSGASVTLNVEKPDGKLVTLAGEIRDNRACFTMTAQSTAAVGQNKYKIILADGDKVAGSQPIRQMVTKDGVNDGATSTNEFQGLAEALSEANRISEEYNDRLEEMGEISDAVTQTGTDASAAETARVNAEEARRQAAECQEQSCKCASNSARAAAAAETTKGEVNDLKTQAVEDVTAIKDQASSAASTATTKAGEANASAEEAKRQAGLAETHKGDALKSEQNAATSAKLAGDHKTAAETAKAEAEKCQTAACNCAQAALDSQTAAKASEDAAKESETNAKTSETNAKTSETNAKTSETNAKTSETNAKTSETNAGKSETQAKNSAQSAAETLSSVETIRDGIVTKEQERQQAESARVEADTKRIKAENARVEAERLRALAEDERETAESERLTQAANDHQRAEQDHAKIQKQQEIIGEMEAGTLVTRVAEIERNKADTTYVDNRFTELIGTAPEHMDTIYEISEWVESHEDVAAGINREIANRETKAEVDRKIGAAKKDLETKINVKANSSDVEGALAGKVGTAAFETYQSTVADELSGKVDKVTGKGLSTYDFNADYKNKVEGIEAGAQKNIAPVANLTSTDNSKPLGAGQGKILNDKINEKDAAQTKALKTKVDKETGKGLSEKNFTAAYETKLKGVEAGAQKNVAPVANLTTADDTKPLGAGQGKVLKDMIGNKSSAPDVAEANDLWSAVQLAAQKGGTDDEELMNVLRAQMQKTLDRLQKI